LTEGVDDLASESAPVVASSMAVGGACGVSGADRP
jgi:hypothetical protein